jgi:uncharacterized protein
VSSKLLAQFVECLEANVLGAAGASTGESAASSPPAEPVDLLRTAGAPVLMRIVPVVLVLIAVVVVVILLLR